MINPLQSSRLQAFRLELFDPVTQVFGFFGIAKKVETKANLRMFEPLQTQDGARKKVKFDMDSHDSRFYRHG